MRDPLLVYNERVKLLAGFVNAMAVGLVGFAVLKPLTESTLTEFPLFAGTTPAQGFMIDAGKLAIFSEPAPYFFADLPGWAIWGPFGLLLHVFSHYLLGYLRKATP